MVAVLENHPDCPECGSSNKRNDGEIDGAPALSWICRDCGNEWVSWYKRRELEENEQD